MWSLIIGMMIVIQLRPTELAASNTPSGMGAYQKRQRSSDSSHDDETQVVPQALIQRTPTDTQGPTASESSVAAGETQKKQAKSVRHSATQSQLEPVDMKSVDQQLASSKSVPHDTTDAQEDELSRKLCRLYSIWDRMSTETLLVEVCKLVFQFGAVDQGGLEASMITLTDEQAAGWAQEIKQDLLRNIDKEVEITWPLGHTDKFPREKEITQYNAQFRHESGFSTEVQKTALGFIHLVYDQCEKGEIVKLAEVTARRVLTLLHDLDQKVLDYFKIEGKHRTDFIIHQMSKVAFDRATPKDPYSLAGLNIGEKDDTAESMEAD